jgi:hypothetical protein
MNFGAAPGGWWIVSALGTIVGLYKWAGPLWREFVDFKRLSPPKTGFDSYKFWRPHLLVPACLLPVVILGLWPAPKTPRGHTLTTLSVGRGEPLKVNRRVFELASNEEHFTVVMQGGFAGGDARGRGVYAVVHEEHLVDREASKGFWVQNCKDCSGEVDAAGNYRVVARLGGTDVNKRSAQEGDEYAVWIYVPEDRSATFCSALNSCEKLEDLPKVLFLSEPIFIRTHRSQGLK